MASLQFAVAVFSLVVLTVQAHGHHGGQMMEAGGRMARGGQQAGGWGGQMSGGWGGQQSGGWGGQQPGGAQGRMQGGNNGQGWGMGQGGFGGQQQRSQGGADSRYRANILDDEDVYGYEAKYPNGEALYVNYRNTEARARRGPDFARSNSISARMNGMNGMSGRQGASSGQDWQQQGSSGRSQSQQGGPHGHSQQW